MYEKKGEKDLAIEALRNAFATGKVNIKFIGGNIPEEKLESKIMEKIEEWESEKQQKFEGWEEKRIFSSWSLKIPKKFSENWEGHKIQLLSPDERRYITASSFPLTGSIVSDRMRSISKKYDELGFTLHSKVRKENFHGFIYEGIYSEDKDISIINCTLIGELSVLLLTFSISDTIKNKNWALQVIDSIEYYYT